MRSRINARVAGDLWNDRVTGFDRHVTNLNFDPPNRATFRFVEMFVLQTRRVTVNYFGRNKSF